MQRRSRLLSYFFSWICIIVLIFSFYVVLVLMNPKSLGVLDSLILQAPCCEKNNQTLSGMLSVPNYLLWKLMAVTYSFSSDSERYNDTRSVTMERESCCDLCRQYQVLRCHFRVDELTLTRFQWHEVKIKGLELHSTKKCNFDVLPEKFHHLIPSYLVLGKDSPINVLESSFIDVKSRNKRFRTAPPAVQVKDMSINMNSLFQQVIDVNATGIVINVVTEKDSIRINSSIEVPLTTIRIGDWLLHEIFDFIPPPPEQEGLYPRMGTINLTGVKIVSTTVDDKSTTMNEIMIPDEFFYPLYHITNLAGSTDQTLIATVLRKSLIMVLRKHLINDEGFISKSMETFLTNVERSSELVQEATDFIYDKINEWTGMIDNRMNRASDILRRFIAKVEQDWYEAMKGKDGYFTKLHQEATSFWEGIDENLFRARQKVVDALENMEHELNSITINGKDVLPQLSQEVKETWNTIKKDWNQAMKEKDIYFHNLSKEKYSYITKLSQDAVHFWEKNIDETLSRAGRQMYDTFDKMEQEWNLISSKGKDVIPQISKEVKETWEVVLQSLHDAEEDLNVRAKKVEKELEDALGEVTKDAKDSIKRLQDNFSSFLHEWKRINVGNTKKDEL